MMILLHYGLTLIMLTLYFSILRAYRRRGQSTGWLWLVIALQAAGEVCFGLGLILG